MDEHEILKRYLRPLAAKFPPARELLDDVAVLEGVAPLAISMDTLVEGVHFPAGILSPDQVARRALRVNLSDLAAAGARPLCHFLSLQLPAGTDRAWMAAFASGLRRDQERFGLPLAGGDTVRTPGPLAVSLTVVGRTGRGGPLSRARAAAGDTLVVTGTIGDAHLGRLHLEGRLPGGSGAERLVRRFLLPEPRLQLGQALAPAAHAAIDVSDGLLADVRNLCRAAGTGARVCLDRIPLSPAGRGVVHRGHATLHELATGGDDYELLVSVPRPALPEVLSMGSGGRVMMTPIGRLTANPDIAVVLPDGRESALVDGYAHVWDSPAR